MDIKIEVASRKEFERDFKHLSKTLSDITNAIQPEDRPPFGITRASIKNSRLLIGRIILGCFEIPAEEVKRSVFRGTIAAFVLYPLAYYLFQLYLFLLAVEIIFGVKAKILG